MERLIKSLLYYADRADGEEKKRLIGIANDVWYDSFREDKEYKSKPAAWISTEEGQHIPLDKNGKAIGGAGGWAKGKNFSYAMTKEKAQAWEKEHGWTPEATREERSKAVAEKKAPLKDPTEKLREESEKQKKHNSDLDAARFEAETWREHLKTSEDILVGHKENVEKERTAFRERFGKEAPDSEDAIKARETELNDQMDDLDRRLESYKRLYKQELSESEFNDKMLERNKMKLERQKLEEEYYKLSDISNAMGREERAQNRVNDYTKRVNELETKVHDLEMTDTSAEYDRLVGEYDKMAEERNAAVLKRFPNAKACETPEDMTDYLRAKSYFGGEKVDGRTGAVEDRSKFESDANTDFDKMNTEYAKKVGERVEAIMTDYPGLIGKLTGVQCGDGKGAIGFHHRATGQVVLAEAFFADSARFAESWEKCLKDRFHPPGTSPESVVDHELTHAIEHYLNETGRWNEPVANIVMRMVQERMNGSYAQNNENKFRKQISKYAYENNGVIPIHGTELFSGNDIYGRNTEWLAEAMEEARSSKKPRKQAKIVRECFEELMREGGLI